MLTFWRPLVVVSALIGAMALASAGVAAQQPAQSEPTLLDGLSKNRNEPVKIQAASLEVRDKDKVATFSGDVHVVQGDTDMRCKVLVVYYESEAAKDGAQPPQTADNGQQQIRRMEARGDVIIVQKDQTATGEHGDFDMRRNIVTLTGNVVIAKGENVLRGQKLVVDLTSGVSKMDSGGGRVEGLFKSNSAQNPGAPGQPKRN
jgi:lipopolysaccharide export system protein LptA